MRPAMEKIRNAKFQIGQVVRHRLYPFRGVVFDIDPEFDNTEEWYQAIPAEARPRKDQPFYHLFAENDETEYVAYVSEQNSTARHYRRTGAPSAGRRSLHQGRQGRLSPARDNAALNGCIPGAAQRFHAAPCPGHGCIISLPERPPAARPKRRAHLAAARVSGGLRRRAAAARPAVSSAALRTPSGRSAARHRLWRNR